jgi:hypothetical protein
MLLNQSQHPRQLSIDSVGGLGLSGIRPARADPEPGRLVLPAAEKSLTSKLMGSVAFGIRGNGRSCGVVGYGVDEFDQHVTVQASE